MSSIQLNASLKVKPPACRVIRGVVRGGDYRTWEVVKERRSTALQQEALDTILNARKVHKKKWNQECSV